MKRINLVGLALVFAAFAGMVQLGSPAALAQSNSSTGVKMTHPKYRIRGAKHAKKSNAKAMKKVEKSVKRALKHETFLGKITRKKGQYVLTAGIFTFKLTDQAEAKKYSGEHVRVTGKLDPETNKIQVTKIKQAKV